MEEHGLADDSIASHKLKEMGSPSKTMTPEEKKIFQDLVNDDFEQFKKVVRSGRSRVREGPEEAGRPGYRSGISPPSRPSRNGLVDKLGYLEDAVDRAIELAGLDGDKVKVVRYKQEAGLGSILLGGQSSKSESLDLKALLEMTTPKAYYLASWLPGLAGAAK